MYHEISGRLSVQQEEHVDDRIGLEEEASSTSSVFCPTCHRPVAVNPNPNRGTSRHGLLRQLPASQNANYFEILSASLAPSPSNSRPPTPVLSDRNDDLADAMCTGYYARFFEEERELGRGQRGSVHLCQHILHGNRLARYAIKKISVGASSASLLATLKEVKHLESLRHANISSYHHSWLEMHAGSDFGPAVPTLFLLLEFANGGRQVHHNASSLSTY